MGDTGSSSEPTSKWHGLRPPGGRDPVLPTECGQRAIHGTRQRGAQPMRLRGLFAAALALGLGLATSAHAEVPPGWIKAGTAPADYEDAVDTTTADTGKSSASIAGEPGRKGNHYRPLMQTIAADD